jgi:putative chitinase
MSIITEALLVACGAEPPGAKRYAAPLAAACDARGITDAAIVPFLANILNESAALTRVIEDTYYELAASIREVFPSHFKTINAAAPYIRNTTALADKVYNGWQGRGLGMLTGYANCTAYAAAIGMPNSKVAAYLTTPAGAADSAAWFFTSRGCLPLALAGDLLGVTRIWEGGTQPIGWLHVLTWAGQVANAIAAAPDALNPPEDT